MVEDDSVIDVVLGLRAPALRSWALLYLSGGCFCFTTLPSLDFISDLIVVPLAPRRMPSGGTKKAAL